MHRVVLFLVIVSLLVGCTLQADVIAPLPEIPIATPETPVEVEPDPPVEEEPPAPIESLEERLSRLSDSLSHSRLSFWFRRNTTNTQPFIGMDKQLMENYDCIALGPKESKYVYLTFDEGYEAGFTPRILDTLQEEQVPAAFFVTGLFVRTQPGLVKRMVDEGHLVENHTVNHPSMAGLSPEQVKAELLVLDDMLEELIGRRSTFFRPPMGHYSEYSLAATQALGYKTVFWSMAYVDWHVNDQPGAAYAHSHVVKNIHPGAVILLHAVSESNTAALPQMIKDLKAQGYEFRSLDDFR